LIAPSAGSVYSPVMEQNQEKIKVVVRNRKARHNYQILATIEAGIALMGSEVKSIREGKVQLADAYAVIENGQVLLKNLHIPPYKQTGIEGHDPTRTRRLLLHKKEIRKTLIPLTIYFKGKHAKIELALAVGRKKYDKRQALKEKDMKRDMDRERKRSRY